MTGKKSRASKLQYTFTKESPLCAGSLKLFVGAKIEALDSRRWYQAKVVKINESTYRVLVHFEGWNSRHDKWFDHDSSSLRPLSLFEANQDDGSKGKELKPGDRVLARWSDSKFYPAKIHSLVNEKVFEVIFFDGFKKKLNKNNIRPDPKRTFENFEEKFKCPPAEGRFTTPNTSSGEGTSREPATSTPSSRTKRRHTEPSTMADFVTSLPGKRSKPHIGTPSDTDDLLASHEYWEQKTRDDDLENIGSLSSSAKRGLALRKQRRLGYPVEEDLALLSLKLNRSSEGSVKKSPKDQLSSSTESLVSNKDLGKKGVIEEPDSSPLSQFVKRKPVGNILQIKLPLKLRGKRRGRKKRFFRLGKVESKAEKGSGDALVEKIPQMGNAEVDKPAAQDKTYPKERASQLTADKRKEEDTPSSHRGLSICEQKKEVMAGGDGSKESDIVVGGSSSMGATSEELVRVPKKRGRKPGKSKPSKISLREPKILPKRDRKLTEKGLELLQIIGNRKGTDCHLKDAFVSLEAIENSSIKDDASDFHKNALLETREARKGDSSVKEQCEEHEGGKVKSETEEVPIISGEKGDTFGRSDSVSGGIGRMNRKGEERSIESHTMADDHELEKDDDKYSDTCSERSGSLVIDVPDEPQPLWVSGQMSDVSQSDNAPRKRKGKPPGNLKEKGLDAKPRTFPRVKYTPSHEERRGNKLAMLKKSRLKKKRKGIKGKGSKESLKGEENLKSDSQKIQMLEKGQLSPSSQSSVGVSPLESLTRMVSDTSPAMGLSSDGKAASVPDAERSHVTSEETSKPIKMSKQQRAPYKSRVKMTDNFLSMVEQDRPSQIERPLAGDLIKEKSVRGRPRHRVVNRTDNSSYQENTAQKKREELQHNDLNEPLEFSSSSPIVDTIDLNKTDIPNMVYSRQEMTSFLADQNRYGPPHVGTYSSTPNSVMGPMCLPRPSQQIELFRGGSPQGPISSLPMDSSEPPGYEKRTPSASHIAAYQGVVGMSEVRGPLIDYGSHLQPVISPSQNTNSPAQVPADCTVRCLRLQAPGVIRQGSWESQKRLENCPCQECRDPTARSMGVVSKEKNESTQDELNSSRGVISSSQGGSNNVGKNGGMLMPNSTNAEKSSGMDQEFVITDVFSLRDPCSKALRVCHSDKAISSSDVKEQNSVDCKSHGSPDGKESFDATREAQKETNDTAHAAGKPKEFETKRKRLDLITGKLGAQKRLSPNDDASRSSGKSERDTSSPASVNDFNTIPTEEAAKSHSPCNKQMTSADQQFIPQQMGYMYPQTSFMPVINPYYEPKSGVPPSSMDVPPQRVISPESRMVPHHPLYMDPRPYYPSPEFFQPIRPVYEAEGIPPLGYQHIPGIPCMPPDMVNHMRFHQVPGLPYGPHRFAPAPRYFVPREPLAMAAARPPPPYSTFPMVSSGQRFRAIAPSGRIPLVVCKQTNCNCHLPHSAPPIQILPQNSQASQASEKAPEDDTASSKGQVATKVSEPMMKGDPRRLTLPLQRMKKMGLKLQKESKDSSNLKDGRERSSSDDLEKEDQGIGETVDEDEDLEADIDSSSDKPSSNSRNEDGKTGKLETPRKSGSSRKYDKGQKKEVVLAPREFVVELELNEFQCKFKGCKKSFRKASSRDNHQRYFHSPRAPQKKPKTSSSSVPSPASSDVVLSPSLAQTKVDPKLSSEDLTSVRSGYSSSVVTDDNISDREKQEESSSDESDDSFLDSSGSVCVDDIIRCKCGDLEEQGFMIQCEQCFTWQHGDCVNLTVQTVPKNYLCYICLNPHGLRPSYKYKNNYDWYKRGTLPSLVQLEGENQEKIAELMQASHALMEDIASIFDVIAGMKKKISLLKKSSHPALRFWRPAEESKDKESCCNGNDGKSDAEKSIPLEVKAEEDCQDKNDLNKEGCKQNEPKTELMSEPNANISIEDGVTSNERNKIDCQAENNPTGKNLNNKVLPDEPSTTDGKTENTIPEKGVKDPGKPAVDETSKYSRNIQENAVDKSEFVERKSDIGFEETVEEEPLDIVNMKLKLQDHLDDIENKLIQRMDEIESNIDVLERKYIECEKKANEGESKSAFKIALPDMTSVVRHLNMINRQLINFA